MPARQILTRYATGERNFQGADLRGQNFQGQTLAGADFSRADIRGTHFTQANLQGTNFTGATAGLQKRWVAIQLVLLFLLAALAGVLQGYSGYWIALYFPQFWNTNYDWRFFATDLAVTIAFFIVILVTFTAIARQGFTMKAFGSIAVIGLFLSGNLS